MAGSKWELFGFIKLINVKCWYFEDLYSWNLKLFLCFFFFFAFYVEKISNSLKNRYTIIVLVLTVYTCTGPHWLWGKFLPTCYWSCHIHHLLYLPSGIKLETRGNVQISLASHLWPVYIIFCTKMNWAIQITPLRVWNWATNIQWLRKLVLGPEAGPIERALDFRDMVEMGCVQDEAAGPISKQRNLAKRGRRTNQKSQKLTVFDHFYVQLSCILSMKHCCFPDPDWLKSGSVLAFT